MSIIPSRTDTPMRRLSVLLPCLVLVLLAFALRGLPALEPAGAATLPSEKTGASEKTGSPAVGPTEVKPAAPRAANRPAEPQRPAAAPSGKDPVIENCRVELIQGVEVPGIEPGVLMSLEAKEGMDVRQGTTLGHIDDREPKMQRIISKLEHEAAKEQAESDIDIQYAHDAWEQARAEYEMDMKANAMNAKAITKLDMMKAKLAEIKAKAGWEKAKIDQRKLVFESDTKAAKVDAADLSIERRQIRAPFDGVVTNVYRHPGEWVAAGDPVIKVIQVDRLRIEGSLSAKDYDPPEIDGRPVSVEAVLAHGRKVTFDGKVVFVSPVVSLAEEYVVFAEVTNRRENGLWVLSPGLPATMTIHLK